MTTGRFNPREASESMVWAIRKGIEPFFEATTPNEYREFHKGLYAMYFAKPTRRTSRLLGFEREMLVLATSFNDLQARTIQFAIDLIDNSGGRLESTVALVAHQDPGGNGKLRNWGGELGLTVIPVYMAGYGLPGGDELERLLFTEFFSHDPFDVTGPVSDDNQFYGRRDEAQELARQLQLGQVRACLGIRKIGKTSIIHRVVAQSQDYHDCHIAVADCSRDDIWQMDSAQLLVSLAIAVTVAQQSPEGLADVAGTSDAIELPDGTRRLSETIRNASRPVVIAFDEVDYITPASATAPHWKRHFNPFWRNLRAAYQEAARNRVPFSILVSGVSSRWFREAEVAGVENAALAFIPEEYLSPLARPASIAMIQTLARTSGLAIDDASADFLAAACSDVPFWIRKAGSYVHRTIAIDHRPVRPDKEEVCGLVESFVDAEGAALAAVALGHLFRVYPELRPVAEAIHNGDAAGQSPTILNVLTRYGVLRFADGAYTISGNMMKAGMESILAETRTASPDVPPEQTTLRFGSADEWAEELSLISAQRNTLELRMRAMAVNFLRFDSLNNRQKGPLVDRVLRVVDEDRRAKLRQLSAEQIVEKFNWSDLQRLIEREWAVFGTIFADKAQFTLHGSVVNIRYDAHAKPADKADIAHYRRSLSWFEDALARV